MKLTQSDAYKKFVTDFHACKAAGIYPFFRPISKTWGTEVMVADQRVVMIGSNDYLGLSHDPRTKQAAADAVAKWGTGPGGSRLLSGNMALHLTLEEKLAEFVGMKRAVVHVTGFSTNLGALGAIMGEGDTLLMDRESHASIIAGATATKARPATFAHNDAESARKRIQTAYTNRPDGDVMLVTEGVFSMSGDVGPMDRMVALKKQFPNLLVYLDDAHGLGVLGPGGRGSAAHFEVTGQVDFMMGTFSKAFASIGGFLAGNDVDLLEYIRHQSRTQIFSAALPAASTAAVIACVDILTQEPERVDALRYTIKRLREGYAAIGLRCNNHEHADVSPIIPIVIGADEKAFLFSRELMDEGVFALPAIYPAVPRGEAMIRTAAMSTHTDAQIDFVLEKLDKLARKYQVRIQDQDQDPSSEEQSRQSFL